MARAFSRVVVVKVNSITDLPFGAEVIYPKWERLTPEGIGVLERPFTAGYDDGPDGLIAAPGYNYTRDSVTLDLVFPPTAIFDNSPSPITT
jgi:hypothetical protein